MDPFPAMDSGREDILGKLKAKIRVRPRRRANVITTATPPVFLVEREAADLIRMKVSTLQNWRTLGSGPPFSKVGARVLYEREALLAWVRDRQRTSTTPPEAA
ncbi:MAG: helix-turn-helix transcriptional regulator [Gemmatimonadota bacterium]